ncbi:TIGR02099 family protein [Metapseudomonas otitidis]|uniref:YhdP family protein n=1 Tax=Metapseudomonas otitidis TaxID=319939 RepID=UPI00227A8A38|nr:YhdP family protein [Pseudomonas otitidis]WAF86993.1 TIGR02099 family protein [Pseudomonas otitidis]
MARQGLLLVTLLRTLLALCALGLVLAALYVSLGRQLMPMVAEYRDDLRTRASDALGQDVEIGALEGSWQGFAPVVVARDVVIGQGDEVLRLDQVRLVPDVLGSLLQRAPKLASIELDGLNLQVVQDESGHWAVAGVPSRPDSPALRPAQLIQGFQSVGRFALVNSQVTVQPWQQKPVTFTYVEAALSGSASSQQLEGRLVLADGQPLSLRLDTRLDPEDWLASEARAYLSLPQTDWARWLPKSIANDWRLSKVLGGGELWAEWSRGELRRAVSRLRVGELKGSRRDQAPVTLQDLAVDAYFDRTEAGMRLQLDSLSMTVGEQRWGGVHLLAEEGGSDGAREWRVRADRIDLQPLVPLVKGLAPLNDLARELVDGLDPKGALRNVQAIWRPDAPLGQRLAYSTNLERLSFGAVHGAPAAENVSGSLTGNLAGGELRLDADDFALHLDHLFPKPWHYREAHARLTWALDEQAFTLVAPYLRVEGEEGHIAGDFLIRLLRDPAGEDYMDLRVGLSQGDARFTEKYLPTLSSGLSPELAEWLKRSIKGGGIDEGFFQYQGSLLHASPPEARSISLFFKVRDAQLDYQPGWPALTDARGDVFVEHTGVRVRVPSGRILDSQVTDARADVPHVDSGKVPHLKLTARLDSSFADGLKILQQAPTPAAQVMAGWQGEGTLDGNLDLDIPLAKAGGEPRVVVDLATQDARLRFATPSLELSALNGAFRYDTASGLSSKDIRARVFGRDVAARATAEGRNGQARSRIQANGVVALKDLTAWLGVNRPLPVSGAVPYRLDLLLDGKDSQLKVDSTLKGVAIDLPAPFGKPAEAVRDSQWRMTLDGAERRYWFRYGDLADLALAAPANDFSGARGELMLGSGRAALPTARGVRVRGVLDDLDLAAWQTVRQRYAEKDAGNAVGLLQSADLRIGRFSGMGLELQDFRVGLQRGDAAWKVDLDSNLLQGTISLPDAQGAPVALDLARLRLPKPADDDKDDTPGPDPLKDHDPHSLPALDVRIAQVQLGDEPLGAWSFKARPVASGTQFSELSLDLKGLHIDGALGWEGSAGASSTWYKGRLEGKNLADVLLAWKYAPTATSERFRLDVDGRWPGSPAWFSLKRFNGSLDAALRKGQFVEADGSAQALRVFGLLNFNSIGRRLRLDFSDLLGKGLAYDRVKGVLEGTDGVFVTRKPIVLEGPSSGLELNGTLDMAHESIDAKLLVTLPVTNNLPLAALIVGAPAIGGALFVVDKLLGDRVARFASVQYKVRGPLQDPKFTFDKPFEKPDS